MIKVWCAIAVAMVLDFPAWGANFYYISPAGLDANSGSISTPWKTFDYAIAKLRPGDTLILRDGTYRPAGTGLPAINCAAGASSGTALAPITLRAENERRARLQGEGLSEVLKIENCSHWIIEGLEAVNADNSNAQSNFNNVGVFNSSGITLRKLLVHHNNRYKNAHLLGFENSSGNLLEDSEFYWFHRHAVFFYYGNNNEVRRIYCNSRNTTDVSGGYPSIVASRGDECVIAYPASGNVAENIISEGQLAAFTVSASDTATGNRLFGSISNGDWIGAIHEARGASLNTMPQSNSIKDFVALSDAVGFSGFEARSAKGSRCDNCMFIGDSSGMQAYRDSTAPGDGIYSFASDNSLAVGNSNYGFRVAGDYQTWAIAYANSFANGVNYSPAAATNISAAAEMDPALGACKIWIPDGSPMKGAGKNGADIGANILFAYEGGQLTSKKLWLSDGSWAFAGATVSGVNDLPGQSLFDVGNRLNVNKNGCSFPLSYSGVVPDSIPPSVAITSPASGAIVSRTL